MTRSLRTVLSTLGVLAALGSVVATASAQGSLREQTSTSVGNTPQHIVAVNPFLPLAGYFQAEYERRVQDNLSVALGTSYVAWGRDILNADVKLRLYPQDRALEGVGFAAGLGVARTREKPCEPGSSCTPEFGGGRSITAPTFSVEVQHQWLLGASRSTAVTVGGGAKRYFIGDARDIGFTRVLPTGRLTIGWAFR
jgi:hypothetical protein